MRQAVARAKLCPMLAPYAARGQMNRETSPPSRPPRLLAGIGLLASPTEAAQAAAELLRARYRWGDADEAGTLVALGGDGFMLHTLHAMLEAGTQRPVFGMNRGTVGFLMNEWRLDRLAHERCCAVGRDRAHDQRRDAAHRSRTQLHR